MSDERSLRWVRERAERDEELYRRYGEPLERDHRGEFVAIGDDGRTLLDTDELALTKRAAEEFGPGRFAVRRIGHEAEIRWRGVA